VVAITILVWYHFVSAHSYIYSTLSIYASCLYMLTEQFSCDMRLLAFSLLLGCSFGDHTFDKSTNYTISKTCFNVSTSQSTLVVHSSFPKAENLTSPFLIYPTSPPLRLPIPIWENKTSSSCNDSSELVPSSSSLTLESDTRTRTTSSPTAPAEFYSAARSLRDRDSKGMIGQTLCLLVLMILPIAS
jgi:hypothetical protein